jgi:RHS repeat-associated protein
MTRPDGQTIAYAYDFNNLLNQITTDLGNFTFAYDANNRRTTRTLPNGTTSTYSYDQASRLTGIQTANNAATIDNVTYTYDNAGNRLTKTQNAINYSYNYDNIYRLINTSPTGTTQAPETYTYDQVGNRLTKLPDTPPNTNATTQYSYDDENRLTGVQITQNGNIKQLTFAYDPFGNRISKTILQDGIGTDCQSPNVCPRTTNYVYDGQNIILEYDQTGHITAKYTHGPNIDEPLAVQQGANTYYYHADGLGSITSLSNASGNIVQTYSYDSFGNMTATGSIRQPFTYTAREYDYATGMYFYRARYYDPKVGRFVTKDPIGFKGGINFYAYVKNNPINYKDPKGLEILKCNRTTGFGIGNHAYLWDTIGNRSCGMQGSSGNGDTSGNEGGPNVDACNPVPNSAGKEADVWKCCSDPAQIDAGPWIPGGNDCHSRAGGCLAKAGLDDPGAPGGRLGSCKSCWLKD